MEYNTGEEDRLSSLPESILLHILSFLPSTDAVRTMLVKKSFSTLWTRVSNLDFRDVGFDYPDIDEHAEEEDGNVQITRDLPFFNFIRNVLNRHQNPQIDIFRVSISTMLYWNIESLGLGHELDSWVNFALRKQVKILEFMAGMMEPDFDLYRWPNEFVSDSLTELKLEILSLNSLTRVHLSSLRVLKLVMVQVSDDVLGEIIRGCPVLKELEILQCSDVYMLSFDAPNVEKLTVDISLYSFYSGEEDDWVFLEINCPNLKSFNFTGFVDCVKFIDLSSIVDVRFSITSRRPTVFKEFPKFLTALRKLAGAERVEFSYEFVTILFYCIQKEAPIPKMTINWKYVKFDIWLTEKHVHGLNRMLRSLPQLEELVINITDAKLSDFSYGGVIYPSFLKAIEEGLDDDTSSNEEERWRFLKNVTINNIENSSFGILVSLTELLLRKASILNKLVFHYKGRDRLSRESCNLTSEELSEFKRRLSTFSKASRHVRIRCIN